MYQLGLIINNKNLVSLHFIDLKMDSILSLLSLNYKTDAYKNSSSCVIKDRNMIPRDGLILEENTKISQFVNIIVHL